ncbi:MAG: FAD-dependent oxidoreductase [Oscillospiraceae bacterium]|jgi:Fe-S oxidoreductase|nr:FAD-dependent oxidoreductase [Oscillospiraceae bacterium]
MKLEEALAFTERCFNGEPASCTYACPFHLDIRAFLEKCEKGRWKQAFKTLRNAVVFPTVVAELCDMPCAGSCQRAQIGDEPIDLLALERAVLRLTSDRRGENYALPPKDGKIAVVGAGIAGLSCALNLAMKKFEVTVFESADAWGGSLRAHPKFAEFDEDFRLQFTHEKVDFRYGTTVTTLDELADYDAIYVATGDGGVDFGLSDSWDAELFTTVNPRVFMGGGVAAQGLMAAIATGRDAARMLEVYLQTGKAAATYGGYDKRNCSRYVQHPNAVSEPRVAAPEGGYGDAEARREAARCLKCDCDACLTSCEMLAKFRKNPQKIATQVYTDTAAAPPYSAHTLTREAYSCSDCGYCKSICPEGIDMGALLRSSRVARAKSGDVPAALHDFWLREMAFNTSEASYFSAGIGQETCQTVFFPGCQLGAMQPEHVLQSYGYLWKNLKSGIFLGCCGAPAYWAGREDLLGENLTAIRAAWQTMGQPRFILACATCARMFAELLPEIETVSLYEILADDESLQPQRVFDAAAMFDPCAARDRDDMREAVRKLAERAQIAVEEMPEKGRCCGYGGHIRVANPELYETETLNRAEMSELPYIVYCANCRDVFASRGKSAAHILDAVFGLEVTDTPCIGDKRQNSVKVKSEIMSMLEELPFEPQVQPWDEITLEIDPETAERIDRKLIGADDMREAIFSAEHGGARFYDAESGLYQCSLVKAVLTYWVRYNPLGDNRFEVVDAFYHRMKFAKG